ncbi:hypothetical protein AB0M29_01465 [Streptomyces sp. NPDC051976]|jgi:hypothetical protein|uniref:hypothetical protein n=1 Tax=Streptomyces sp. NPDC051976 TaxID=3154947 RepID=UPI0034468320
MSANYPPPQQSGQNPYGQQPPQYGQQPYGAPQPQFGAGGYPPPAPVAPARDNVGLGLAVGFVAAIIAAFAYAGIMRAMAKDDGHYTEVGYVAIGVGLLVGFALGKVGGRNPLLPVAGIVLSLLAVFFGEILGLSMIASHYASLGGADISWFKVFTDHFGDMFKQWKHDFDVKSFFFLAIAGAEGFAVARRAGR